MRFLLSLLLTLALCAGAVLAQTARVQLIHNAPDPTVDVYVNGLKALDDFAFRTATNFIDLPAGLPLQVAIAPENSTSAADAIATFNLTLESGKTYAVTASGLVGDPNTPFTLLVDDEALEVAGNPNKVDVNVLHGSPDAPPVDVVVRTGSKIVSNLAYSKFTPYLSVDPGVYYLDIKPAGTNVIVQTYLADLTGLAGQAIRVMASGLLGGAPAFGLYAVTAGGAVVELPASPVARVQVIHNAIAPTVDVYANDALLIDDFEFRTATPFIFVPAEVDIDLGIAPANSASADDAIATFTVNLENGKTYIVTASGILGDLSRPFDLNINDDAREASDTTATVDIAVLHGSPNAPAVDVDAVFVATNVIENLPYDGFTPYLSLPPAKYDFAIRATGDPNVVASFRADLSGLGGGAAYVFASGLLGGDPGFGLFAALPNGTVIELPLTPTARLQVIHNSPDPTVDVYADNALVLDDFEFRTATPFIDFPADRDITLGVALPNSTSAADAIATFNVNLEEGKTYIVTASGIVGDANAPFTLVVNDEGREAALDPNSVDIAVLHGSPNAPAVDVDAIFVANDVITDLAYGEFTPYLSLPPAVYDLAVRAAGEPNVVAAFRADLSGLAGGAAYVFASGLLGGTPGFGLFAALPNGTVIELPLTPVARVQVIHNAIAPTVDVYANDFLLIDDFEFRTATPFVTLPAGVDIVLGVAPANSTSASDAIATFTVNLEDGKTYIVTASGILGDLNTPFGLNINDDAREAAADPDNVDIAVLHGSPNAPAVDVDAVFVADDVVNGLAYGEFTTYLSLPPAKYDFAIRATGDPNVVASFRADLSGLAGGAAYVFASGLLGGDPGFGLFAALSNGAVVELPLTPTARLQVIHNSPDPTVDVYADNALVLDDFEFRTATPFIDFPADRDITLGVALPNSTSAADAIATFNVNLEEGKTYIVTASGIVGDANTPFTLVVNDEGREAALDPNSVDIAVLHGSPNAPAVDVDAIFVANSVITDLAYGEFTPYLSLPPAVYDFAVRAAGAPNAVAAFRADLSGLAGGAAYVFASGLLGGTPGFGLFAALPNGTVIELPLTPLSRVQVIHNSPSPTVDVYAGNVLLIDDFAFRTATPFIDFPADRDVVLGVALPNSTSANDAIATFNVNLEEGKTYIVTASGVVGSPVAPFTLIVNDDAREAAADPNSVDIAVLHGSPDAPAVDVDAVFVADNVITNLPYGAFTPYLSLPPAIYDFAVRPAGNPSVVASYRADLSSLAGGAAYVFASGLLSGAPGFGLFAALPNGVVVELPLTPTARVQVIHNSPEPTVDVYAGNSLLIKDFGFRTATPFVELPAGRDFTLGIAPAGSTSAADAIFTQDVNLPIGGTLAVMAQGVVGNPTRPFTLVIDPAARETASPGAVALSVLHGSPDAPAVDVVERLAGPLVTNLAYGAFTGYLEVPADDNYYLDIKPAGVNQIVGTYRAELGSFGGQAIRVFASGFLSQAPGFGLFAALPDGNVIELRLSPVARVQIIHNSPAPTVDIYANGFLAFDDFEYLQATAFDYVPAEVPIELAVAPENSTSVGDAFFTTTVTFENAKTYYLVANGTGANFTILVNDQAREQAANPAKIEFAVLHGSPNAPAVDVRSALNGSLVVSNLAFGEFTPYLALDPDLFIVDVTPAGNPATVVGTWGADLEGAEGIAGLVMATGLLGGTPEIDLVVVLPNGFVVGLAPLTRAQVIHNSPSPTVDVYLDDIRILDDLAFRQATPFVLLPAREPFTLSVAPGNSTSVSQAIYSLPINRLETGKDYIIMAAGVVGSPTRPFQLYLNEDGRRRSASPVLVDLTLFHGSPDAPAVDVQIAGGPVVFDDIAFGQFSEYISAPAANYIIQITPANDNTTIVQSYRADISALGGQAAVVFASGFLSGTPGFEVWVALANGTTFPLPVFVRTNDLEERLLSLQLAPNPAVHETWMRLELSEPTPLRYAVRDLTGRLVYEGNLGNLPAGPFAQRIEVGNLPSGMYQLELRSENSVQTRKFIVQRP